MAHNSQQSTASTEWLHLQKRGEEISNGRHFQKRTEDMQTPKRKRYQKDATSADDIITLIHLVRQNPALYNYKLQPNQRRRIDVLNGWAQIAAQIGNKYTVEECRRKWKNLRDTYHQYRLRKPKLEDGLSKWRYAKELDFLSNVYQPKLKSQRHQNYVITAQRTNLHELSSRMKQESTRIKQEASSDMSHHSNGGITLVNDDEAFILTTYEESVNDDVTTIDHGTHEDPSMSSHMELPHDDDVEDVEETVKNEHTSSLDDATGTEVNYEEVCLYEEANAPSVDCETIIGGDTPVVARSTSTDSKVFTQHHDQHAHTDSFNYMNDFCIESIPHLPSGSAGGGSSNSSVIGTVGSGGSKLKSVSVATAATTIVSAPVAVTTSTNTTQPTSSSVLQLQPGPSYVMYGSQPAEELDLFFAFLKQKMQRFAKEEITAMQVEFLNCVQRREAEKNQNNHGGNGAGGGSVAIIHHQL